MKRPLLTFCILLLGVFIYAEGWRPGEQQVKIQIETHAQALILKEYKIDYEPCGMNSIKGLPVTKRTHTA